MKMNDGVEKNPNLHPENDGLEDDFPFQMGDL